MYGFCLTLTANFSNLSKKIHTKNLKIFLKKLVWGTKIVGFFFGGGNFQGKMFRSQKKASFVFGFLEEPKGFSPRLRPFFRDNFLRSYKKQFQIIFYVKCLEILFCNPGKLKEKKINLMHVES